MKRRTFLSLLILIAVAIPGTALADPPEQAPVESPEMKKKVTIKYPAGLIDSSGREIVEGILREDLGIEEIIWRTAPSEAKLIEITASEGVDKKKVLAIVWANGPWEGCDDDH